MWSLNLQHIIGVSSVKNCCANKGFNLRVGFGLPNWFIKVERDSIQLTNWTRNHLSSHPDSLLWISYLSPSSLPKARIKQCFPFASFLPLPSYKCRPHPKVSEAVVTLDSGPAPASPPTSSQFALDLPIDLCKGARSTHNSHLIYNCLSYHRLPPCHHAFGQTTLFL